MRLHRTLIVVTLILGAALARSADKAGAQDVSLDPARLPFVEQRIKEIGDELNKLQSRLKDGKAIVSYYDVIVRGVRDFYQSFDSYTRSCFERRLQYEQLKKANNPFADSDFLPALRRCAVDRQGLERGAAAMEHSLESIKRDIDFISVAVSGFQTNMSGQENELKMYQLERGLTGNIKRLGSDVQGYKSGPRAF